MAMIAKNRVKSSWTPLSNEETNNKIFEERIGLIGRWYKKWSDEQRTQVLDDLLAISKKNLLEHVRDIVHERVHPPHVDFTRMLPRVISLYIISFLDPTSLCRASQVCWYWHDLCERDELWMERSVRVGWKLPFTPSPYEHGVWKRFFTENIKFLIALAPQKHPKSISDKIDFCEKRKPRDRKTPTNVPWRGSDPVPMDTWRYNYLQNDEFIKSFSRTQVALFSIFYLLQLIDTMSDK